MLRRDISGTAQLSHVYTNHSIQATNITTLDDAGFEARNSMRVIGYKSEVSVYSYSNRLSTKKKQQSSDTLACEANSAVENIPPVQPHLWFQSIINVPWEITPYTAQPLNVIVPQVNVPRPSTSNDHFIVSVMICPTLSYSQLLVYQVKPLSQELECKLRSITVQK